MGDVQAGSLSMPGGRYLKENLYNHDSPPDVHSFLCIYV